MATNPISGKGGKVLIGATPVAEVEEWSLDEDVFTSRWVSSDTAGAKRTIGGATEFAGSFNYKFDMAATGPIVLNGASVTLKLYLDSTHFYQGAAVLKARKNKVSLQGEVIGGSCTFEGDGVLTQPTLP